VSNLTRGTAYYRRPRRGKSGAVLTGPLPARLGEGRPGSVNHLLLSCWASYSRFRSTYFLNLDSVSARAAATAGAYGSWSSFMMTRDLRRLSSASDS
jgi:hypothetical protein